jgi:hypothetical protein
MHEQALMKLEGKIRGSLRHCEIVDNWPQFESFTSHVHSCSKELLKTKSQWLTISDIYSIYYDLVYENVYRKSGVDDKLTGLLPELLTEDELEELVGKLLSFYISIPRNYSVYLPLPQVSKNIDKSIEVSNLISLVHFEDGDQIPGGYGRGLLRLTSAFDINKIYLRTEIKGYCNNRLEGKTTRNALSRFKILIQQGLFGGLFKRVDGQPTGVGLLSGLTHYQIPKSKMIRVDHTDEEERITTTDLPIEITKLLESLDFNWNEDPVKTAHEADNLEHPVKGYFLLPSLLIETDQREAEPIKTAIEWCLDSIANENDTLSFLQLCIGLEALLGDVESDGSITETLADRCAYLTSTDIKGRKNIKSNFKKLYKIRSKLVHGVKTSIEDDQLFYKNWGQNVLEIAILKEIKHLKLSKKT